MLINPYLIPDKLTNIHEGNDKHHTWLGVKLPKDKGILLVLSTTSFHEDYADEYIKWFIKDDNKTVYIKPSTCFIMPNHVFEKYFVDKNAILKNPNQDYSNYITSHASDNYHIKDLSDNKWKEIFDFAAQNAQVYDADIRKHASPAKIFVIVFAIIAIIALALGLGLGFGL